MYLTVRIFVSFSLASMYRIVVEALDMLSTIATGFAIDAYGPISDNAGGIAEMDGMSHRIWERTDALDAAGNTTAAIGKLLMVFLLEQCFHTGFHFSAMTMKSVGSAALKRVEKFQKQFNTIPVLMEGTAKPNYANCVEISTDESIKEMIPLGALVMLTPLIVGTFFFRVETLSCVLAGSLVSSVQLSKRRSRGDHDSSTGSTAASTSTSMRVHGRGGARGGRGRATPSTSSVELLVCVWI
ncbi:hypothetical protein C5167_022386 [Papaver somniferum]|uniref:H(+)-exporting diphosphatase n=1 Tax=Papaver somniferum TaxID=3469 RepID=A0A4Y7JLG0_PAPSO|nr:hypothetical protein C5167_022386 [Papaver somniferum]